MTDPRLDVALYALPEAARLGRLPRRTLANWVNGYRYPAGGRTLRAKPVVVPVAEGPTLSFVNLMEVLTLHGFRKAGVPMQRVRKALDYAAKEIDVTHMLASELLLTDGKELFWRFQAKGEGEHLVNLTRGGQKVFPEAVLRYLRQMEWGKDRVATRWWPDANAREGLVVVDPRRSFGAPVIAGTGIRTEDVFQRFSAGEPLEDLSEDYGLTRAQAEAAIRIEARFLQPESLAA
jgi:uncharacterized protein (DUF433 family)